MEQYQHTPLPENRFIRVLNLLPPPSTNSSELHGKLIPVSLDKLPPFEALSYSWGAPVLSSTIICDGHALNITSNCEAALRRLRQPAKARLVWVDAICIDQTSVAERNQQVKYMGEIYGQARRVLVWLGESTERSEVALRGFRRVYDGALTGRLFGVRMRERVVEMEIARLKDECQAYSIPNVPVLDSVLQDVFSRSWFSRLWTIQEVALSRNAVMLCGATEIPFFTFVQGSRTISVKENRPWAENPLVGQGILGGSVALHMRMSEALDKYPSRWHKVLNKAVNSVLPKGHKPPSPLTRSRILQLAHDKNATDPKDKVYALYSLFSALNIPITGEVDYNKPLADIYYRETLTAISEDKSLDVFYNITGNDNPELRNLPSWVPDWSDTTSPRCTNYQFYAAGGPTTPIAKLSPDGLQVTCYCRIIGFVEKIAEKTMPRLAPLESFKFENILPTIHNWATFCEPGFTQNAMVSHRRKKYYESKYFTLENFCDILVRGTAPYFDPYGEVEISHTQSQNPNAEYQQELQRMGSVWAPIATSVTTDILYRRLTDYPESIVSDDVMTGISKALEGTPSARTYHRLVEVVSEGLVMFKTESGFFGTALPNIQEKDEVALFAGLRMPFIIRPGETAQHPYRIIGPAYVQDTMDAEYWSDSPTPENFYLVLG